MRIFRVLDLDIKMVMQHNYDLLLFASGYESRCVHVPSIIKPKRDGEVLVFGFTEESSTRNRINNDVYFFDEWGCKTIPLSTDDERPIYEQLNKCANNCLESMHILVDYSSMSRLWYAAVLNWARFASSKKEVIIDFVYAMGKYRQERRPMVIRNMVSIPGCEGRSYSQRETVAVFGLGFNGLAALCVLDQLEVDIVYAFLASPGSSEKYIKKTKKINRALISNQKTKAVLELPISSIESCYRYLADTIAVHRASSEITIVPMGPKPHVLASILLAMRFPEVACLRVSGAPDIMDVQPSGDLMATRVVVRGDE